jgi:hypothetical protein
MEMRFTGWCTAIFSHRIGTSLYYRYRNIISILLIKQLTTYFREMAIVDTLKCTSRGENALNRTEDLKRALKGPTLHLRVKVGQDGVVTVNGPFYYNKS